MKPSKRKPYTPFLSYNLAHNILGYNIYSVIIQVVKTNNVYRFLWNSGNTFLRKIWLWLRKTKKRNWDTCPLPDMLLSSQERIKCYSPLHKTPHIVVVLIFKCDLHSHIISIMMRLASTIRNHSIFNNERPFQILSHGLDSIKYGLSLN